MNKPAERKNSFDNQRLDMSKGRRNKRTNAMMSGLLVGLLAQLPACTPPVGGNGSTSDGRPLVATLTFGDDLMSMTSTIVSPDGWSCTTTHNDRAGPDHVTHTVIKVPMTCSDGVSGTSLWSRTINPLTITISFALPNGRTGSVRHQIGK